MRKNNRRNLFNIPKKLIDNEDKWEQIAKKELAKDKISDSIYKGIRQENGRRIYEVRDLLKKIFHNKCAYCESRTNKPEIEHYRPKKEVYEDPTHPGYYWLCYEWTNLLPSCRYCNTEGGKGNYFPIAGTRQYAAPLDQNNLDKNACKISSNELLNEKPLLLNPEVDEVENYFSFKITGEIIGIDSKNRGNKTIKICNLNRDDLLKNRQDIIDKHLENIEDIIENATDNFNHIEILFRQIKKKLKRVKDDCAEDQIYSLVSMNILSDYENLIISQLPTKNQKDFVREAYLEFIDEYF
ncbi:MAG: hypothetical protein N4A49_04495 [Marinifilaceae bacterium]|jgi:uncharacterized protein (TIGR02646 family)|nr:hypothetical protein [Marinifilaceae bacterium]